MSLRSMVWALEEVKGVNPSERLVLLYLANYDKRDREIFPHVQTIADGIDVAKRTVQRCLISLEEKGLICREERRRKDGSRTSDRYFLSFDGALSKQHSDNLALCEEA